MPLIKTAFQVGIAYWTGDQGLRRCTHEERGVWLDVLCLMHQAEERGILRWPLREIAESVKAPICVLESLVHKGVMGGRSSESLPDDELFACSQIPFVFTPRHAGKDGEPVILIDEVSGDIWFAPEMLIEEHKRKRQVENTRRVGQSKVDLDGLETAVPAVGKAATGTAATVKATSVRKVPDCPYAEIAEAYHEILPAARRVRMLGPESALGKSLKARWRAAAVAEDGPFTGYDTAAEGMRKWRAIFEFVTESKFLMGKVGGNRGRAPFMITLAWLVGPENFDKVINGFYHREHSNPAQGVEAFAESVMGTTAEVMSMMRRRSEMRAMEQGSLL